MAELFANWGEYVIGTTTVGRSCGWEIMVVPVDEFEDAQEIQYKAKTGRATRVRHENGVNLAN